MNTPQFYKEDNPPLQQFIAQIDPTQLPRVKGTAVYPAARRETAPYSLLDNLRHNQVLHERIVLLTVVTERTPFVVEAERMKLEPLDKGFTEMSLHFGFAEGPAVPPALEAHRAEFPSILLRPPSFSGGKRRSDCTLRIVSLARKAIRLHGAQRRQRIGLLPDSAQARHRAGTQVEI